MEGTRKKDIVAPGVLEVRTQFCIGESPNERNDTTQNPQDDDAPGTLNFQELEP